MRRSSTYTEALVAVAALLLLVACVPSWSSSYRGGERSEEIYRERREEKVYRGGARTEEEMRRMFAEFMAKHGKAYDSISMAEQEQEQERRYAGFKESVREADKLTFSRFYNKLRPGPIDMTLRSFEENRMMFKGWMAKHGKTYDSFVELQRRFLRFKINLQRVDRHNAALSSSSSSYRLSLDRFADLTYHEFVTRCQEPTMELEECSTTTMWA